MSLDSCRAVSCWMRVGLAALLAAAWGPVARANPSDQKPNELLDVHNLAGSQPLLEDAAKRIEDVTTKLQAGAGRSTSGTPKLLAHLHVELRVLRRLGQELEIYGEPAGVDLIRRVEFLEKVVNRTIEEFKASRNGLAYAEKIKAFLSTPKMTDGRIQAVHKFRQAVQQQQWLPNYQTAVQTLDELSSYTAFLAPPDAQPINSPFGADAPTIMLMRNRLVLEAVRKRLADAGTALLPNFSALTGELNAAATALQTQATATVGGNALHGPQCMEHFGGVWRKLHRSALQCRAVEWARLTVTPDVGGLTPPSEPNRIRDEDYAKSLENVIRGLAALIEADAQRAAPEEVPGLYAGYLRVLAPLVSRTADDKLEAACLAALQKLVAKSLPLAKEVQAYHEATDELLRWRARAAAAEAAGKSGKVPATGDLLARATVSRADYQGLIGPQESKLTKARFTGPCPAILAGASKQVVDQPVLVRSIAGLAGGKAGVSRYEDRHYAIVTLAPLAEPTMALKQDLLVTEQLPALSLRASVALESAAQGDLVAAGGPVSSLTLEGLIPRFATLPESALPMAPLGPLPAESSATDMVSQALVRLNVTPQWLQHRYFFVDLAQAAKPAAPQ